MLKAIHEAKVHTSWINPNAEYDEAVSTSSSPHPRSSRQPRLPRRLPRVPAPSSAYGLDNALAQTLLKFTTPGVPDTYQGTELWDFSLVDPDNRRPVDYEHAALLPADLRAAIAKAGVDLRELARDLVASMADGRIKLHVTHRSLACRRDHPGLFTTGEYLPLTAEGPKAPHLFAFARRWGEAAALVAVPRLVARLIPAPNRPPRGAETWADTRLLLPDLDPALRWRDAFTGALLAPDTRPSLAAADLFAHLPVALLLAEPAE